MKKTLLGIAMAFAATTFAAAPTTAPDSLTTVGLKPMPQQMQAAAMTAQFLTRFHYKTMPLDDAMSQKIFDRYHQRISEFLLLEAILLYTFL